MNFVILSNQLFDYPLKTNKWHLATRLAQQGHKVLFVDPPIRLRKFVKQIFQGRWSPRRILTFTYQPQENLIVYTPVGIFPLPKINFRLHLKRIRDSAKRVLWVYHVEMQNLEDYIAALPHRLLIYDCVDNYPAFPRYHDDQELKEWVVKRERWLAKKADIVFTTAPGLQDRLSRLNPNTYYVGNAGDYHRFAEAPNFKSQIPNQFQISDSKPIIGFTGAIDSYKVDLSLLVKVAKAYPNYSLVLVGPRGVADDEPNLAELQSLSNVYFLGARPYRELPWYFCQFDVYVIPYNLNAYTLGGCFPVKFFDALAAGLPTVVTNLPCYREFSRVCYIAKNDRDFVEAVKTAIEEDSAARVSERQRVARQNSWDIKVERMLEIVNEAA